jgi:phosphoserine phosphatase RsbU/P
MTDTTHDPHTEPTHDAGPALMPISSGDVAPAQPSAGAGDAPARRPGDATSDSAALLELSSILNASLDLPFILSNVLLSLMGKLLATRGVVLIEHAQWHYRIASMKGVTGGALNDDFVLPVDWTGTQHIAALDDALDEHVRAFTSCCRECGIVMLVPLRVEERMVGVIGLGARLNGAAYDSGAITFLESVAAVAASAVKNAVTVDALRDANRRLDAKIQEMNTLFELSREMTASFDEQAILRVLGYALMGQLRAMHHLVFVREVESMRPALVRHDRFDERDMLGIDLTACIRPVQLPVDRAPDGDIERWMASLGLSLLVPMLGQQQVRGVLCIGGRLGGQIFDPSELEYIGALANITMSALDNARLVKEIVEKEHLERELDLARSIQKGLLPDRVVTPEGYQIAALNESSQQVGGDYYDVIELSSTRSVLAIGDVSGKGIPASLLMANVQAAFRTIIPLGLDAAEATARINALVHANTAIDKFITFFWGVLDTDSHTFTYVNAGHNPPCLVRADGSIDLLEEGGLILGVFNDPPPYAVGSVTLAPGDTIVMYTDGVNEALSVTMQEFGDARLQHLLAQHAGDTADHMLEAVRDAVHTFSHGAPQSDDITLVVVHRLP